MRKRTVLAVDSRQVDLWLVFTDEVRDDALLRQYRDLMSDAERDRERRFYFERDRHCYLVTRALTRLVLSKYAPIAPREWTFSTNAYGRPQLAHPELELRGLTFNIAHAGGLVVLGVTYDCAFGVDTESVQARQTSMSLAEWCFAPREAAALYELPVEQQQQRFFEYWTLKESYIKARGMGLSIPLDQFSFEFPHDGQVQLAVDASQADPAERWRFWQFHPAPEHLVAICAERVHVEPPLLTVTKIVPQVSEEPVHHSYLRVSM